MKNYMPSFDTEVRTATVVERRNTMHINCIDWDNYPFDDPAHTACMCLNDERKKQEIERFKEYLRTCEQWATTEAYASSYGGWPRIWHRVVGVGMASAWPYWKPRPTVLVHGTLGIEWLDWTSLTGAELRGEIAPAQPTKETPCGS